MPLALRFGPYRFFFWSRENNEPPHVHVKRDRLEAKFWLEPVELAQNWGFPRHELNLVSSLEDQRRDQILEKWREHFEQA